MVGDFIRQELHRPLEGDRRFVYEQRGRFTLRRHPELEAQVRAEKARLRVEEDIRNFRRLLNRERNLSMLG